ncbi:hypothetical protein OKW49_008232 [Paraburkholderia youngii]|uniref:hypothetical protein n=1 Tax=Paraburkholderia youngii TaxID=2782701 RepID=UPI003D1C4E8F
MNFAVSIRLKEPSCHTAFAKLCGNKLNGAQGTTARNRSRQFGGMSIIPEPEPLPSPRLKITALSSGMNSDIPPWVSVLFVLSNTGSNWSR